jgi:predicted DNA-binding transcriptional regulator AlpA
MDEGVAVGRAGVSQPLAPRRLLGGQPARVVDARRDRREREPPVGPARLRPTIPPRARLSARQRRLLPGYPRLRRGGEVPPDRLVGIVRIPEVKEGSGISGSNRRHSAWEGRGRPGISNGLQVKETIESASPGASYESQQKALFAGLLLLGSNKDEPPLLSVRELVRLLGLSTTTVYALCPDGASPTVRILNTIRVRQADVWAFIGSCRPDTTARSRLR